MTRPEHAQPVHRQAQESEALAPPDSSGQELMDSCSCLLSFQPTVLVALVFLLEGLGRIEPVAHGPVLLPGIMNHINPCIQQLAQLAIGGLQCKTLS